MKNPKKAYTLREIVNLCGGELRGDESDESIVITGVAPLSNAEEGDITFLLDRKHLKDNPIIKASALVTDPALALSLEFNPLIISPVPKAAFAKIAQLFFDKADELLTPGVHPTSIVEEKALLGEDVYIGPMTYVGAESSIGSGSKILARTYVGRNVTIGKNCIIYPHVVILDGCRLGDRVTVHSGTVIGSDGFGYAQDLNGEHVKIPQMGIVVIENDVEIGANCTIDRATFGETRVKKGSKIDNLVMIGHNVVIGERCILAGQVGIAGSTVLGNDVFLGGQVGVADHVKIGDGVKAAAKVGIAQDLKPRSTVIGGFPAMNYKEYFKHYRNVLRLDRFKKELDLLKKKVLQTGGHKNGWGQKQ